MLSHSKPTLTWISSYTPDDIIKHIQKHHGNHWQTGFIFPCHRLANSDTLRLIKLYDNYYDATATENVTVNGEVKKTLLSGLPGTANLLSRLNMPVLGLPIIDMPESKENIDDAVMQQAIDAITKLWKAVGFGIDLLYPDVLSTHFALSRTDLISALYLNELNILSAFLESKASIDDFCYLEQSNNNGRLHIIPIENASPLPPGTKKLNDIFIEAYNEGLKERQKPEHQRDPWYQKKTKPEPKSNDYLHYQKTYHRQKKELFWKKALYILATVAAMMLLGLPWLVFKPWYQKKAQELKNLKFAQAPLTRITTTAFNYAQIKLTRQLIQGY